MFIGWWKNKSYQYFKNFKFWTKKLERNGFFFFTSYFFFLMFIRFKFCRFKHRSHVHKKSCKKTCLGFHKNSFQHFCVYICKWKYWWKIKYTCEKSPTPYEFSYLNLFNFFHSNAFHVNVICKTFLDFLYIFWNPNYEWAQ